MDALQESQAQPHPEPFRDLALKILTKVEGTDARIRELMEDALRQSRPPLSQAEGGLLHELVYGSLRQRGRLDYYLSRVSHRPLEQLSPWVRCLLRLYAYQILESPRLQPAEAVEEATEVSKTQGHDGVVKFVNGVLKELCRQKEEGKLPPPPADPVLGLGVQHSHPVWMARRLVDLYGFDRAMSLMAASNQGAPLTLRVNTLKARREEVAGRLHQAGFHVEACRFSPWGLRVKEGGDVRRMPGFAEGEFSVQDESSQLVVRLLDPKPGWHVADVCAAPGGKAIHLAEMVGRHGLIWAFDRKTQGLDKLNAGLRRHGPMYAHLLIEVRDALFPREDLLGRLDAVLVDAPCSGLGVLRRRAEARWQVKPDAIPQQAQRQKKILEASARYVKPGGVLVYAACTLEEQENEDVVKRFLDEHPEFCFERAGQYMERELSTSDGFLRIWPGQELMDGFFAARMRRVKG
jgi:16S rRNA (cytosine967-C5)-methyltransferase